MIPNLFIVGAPKCGTSSLFRWLLQHPDVGGTVVKEPFFLIDPKHPLARSPNAMIDGMESYAELFTEADRSRRVRMDGTTHYLFDSIARDIIAGISNARVIIVLREPAARVYSSFTYTANNLAQLKRGLSFQEYLNIVRESRPLAPRWCSSRASAFVLERDLEYSRYHVFIKPYLRALGSDRVRIVVMEDMLTDTLETVSGILEWLELDLRRMPELNGDVKNKTEHVRFPFIHSCVHKLNARLKAPEILRAQLRRAYKGAQYGQAREMSQSDLLALDDLRKSYRSDNLALSKLTGLELSSWSGKN